MSELEDNFTSVDDLLSALRKGNDQKLEIGLGELKIPVRLMNAKEEVTIMAKARDKVLRDDPQGIMREQFESIQTMKDILYEAVKVNNGPGMSPRFFDALRNEELVELFDQYTSLNHTVNPNIQAMDEEEIMAVVDGIKKKTTDVRSLYTYQLAEIGKFFLTKVIPNLISLTDKNVGSD